MNNTEIKQKRREQQKETEINETDWKFITLLLRSFTYYYLANIIQKQSFDRSDFKENISSK